MRLGARLLHLLYPPVCAHCLEDLPFDAPGAPLCAACEGALEPIVPLACVRCGLPIDGEAHCRACRGRRFKLERLRAPLLYTPPLRSLVARFKYGGRPRLAAPLAAWMMEAWRREAELSADALVPVPLHPKRRARRGYNQAELLARELHRLGAPPVLEALEKVLDTAPQAELDGAARRRNLQDAFRSVRPVRGLRLLLVDDVATTGSTLEEAARVLRADGAAWVGGLALARQRPPAEGT